MSPAVVKANYVPMSSGGRAAMAASADYYAHRPDSEGGREYRPGFDAENEDMAKNEVYGRIEQGEGEYAYRIVLSPGEDMEAGDVREWARDVMEPIEEDGGQWVGFVHDDHTGHPHAHIVAYADGKLDREDLAEMRRIGTEGAERWMERNAEYERELEQDPTQGYGRDAEQREDRRERAAGEGGEPRKPEPAMEASGNSGRSAGEWARQAEHYARYGARLIEREERITAELAGRLESHAEHYAGQGADLIERGLGIDARDPMTEQERDELEAVEAEAADAARVNEEIDQESEARTIANADDPALEPSYRGREEEHGLG